jgi:hypothetical protein
MARSTTKAKGRPGNRSFIMFPHQLIDSPRFHALSAHAVKALMYLASQFKGRNNGDLGVDWKIAKPKGLKSNAMLRRGVMELIAAGIVIQTRQGGRNRCSLFALAWFPIDDCGGKLDMPSTRVALIDWRDLSRSLSEPREVQLAPSAVQSVPNSPTKSVH